MSTPSYDDNLTVTNNLTLPSTGTQIPQTNWDGSVICISGSNTSGTEQDYDQSTLIQLSFSKGETLANGGNSDFIVLNPTANPIYNLIFAQADNLFPVQSNGVGQKFDKSTNTDYYSDIILSTPAPPTGSGTNSNSSTVNAWLFCQNISAYPTSPMATAFVNLGSAQSLSANQSAVNAFFQGYPAYQNVTLSSYELVSSYLFTYAFAWANFASTYTYYLYQATTSSGKVDPESGTTSSGESYTAVGKVVFTQQSAGNPAVSTQNSSGAWVTSANGNYDIQYYADADDTSGGTALYFSSQQLVSSLTDTVPQICLQCLYSSLSTVTGLSGDWGTIQPILVGTVSATQVLGVDQSLSESTKIKNGLNSFFKSNAFEDSMAVVGLLMGVKLLFDIIASVVKAIKGGKDKAKEKDEEDDGTEKKPDDISEADKQAAEDQAKKDGENQIEDQSEISQERLQDNLDRLGDSAPQVSDPKSVAQDQDNIARQNQEKQNQLEQNKEEDELEGEDLEIDNEAEYGVNQQLENQAKDVDNQMDEVSNLDPASSNSKQQLDSEQQSIKQDQQQVDEIGKDEGLEISSGQKNAVDNVENVDSEIQQEEQDNEEKVEEGKGEEDDGLGKDVEDDL